MPTRQGSAGERRLSRRCCGGGRRPASPRVRKSTPERRMRSIAPFVIAFIALLLLSLEPAEWAQATGLRDTVPRQTPTRLPSPTPSPSVTARPTFSPTPAPTHLTTPPPSATPGTTAPSPTAAQAAPTATAAVEPAWTATRTPEQPAPSVTAGPSPPATTATPERPAGSATPELAPPTLTPTASLSARPSPTGAASSSPPAGAPSLAPTKEPVSPTATPALEKACTARAGEPLSLRWPDGSVAVALPAVGITTSLCVYVSQVDPVDLPAPPAGYRMVPPVARVRVTDANGIAGPAFVFAAPYTVTLRYSLATLADAGAEALAMGYLAEGSAGWAILEMEHDRSARTVGAYPRRPGVFALLVRVPPEVESASGWNRIASMPQAGVMLGLAAAVLAAGVLIGRRRLWTGRS